MRNTSPLLSFGTILVGSAVIFIGALAAAIIGFQAFYNGYIYPGVQVGWVDVAGMKTEDAAALLDYHLTYPHRGRVLLRDGDQIWVASPPKSACPSAAIPTRKWRTASGALVPSASRSPTNSSPGTKVLPLTPAMTFDERQAENYLKGLAAEIDQPTVEASLEIEGVAVIVRPGQVGRALDVPATHALIQAQVQTLLDGEILLVIEEDPPAILDASEQAELARQILQRTLSGSRARCC